MFHPRPWRRYRNLPTRESLEKSRLLRPVAHRVLAPELWRGWEYVSMNIFSTPGGKAFWSERSDLFADAFQKYVAEDIIPRQPHPQARAWGAFSVSN